MVLCLYVIGCDISAQSLDNQSTETQEKTILLEEPAVPGVDMNFLFGYYHQDGEHSAVTGGIGTEELTDRDFRFVFNIALDSIRLLNVTTGINYYSSASTDKIDSKVSSASSEDVRTQVNITYTQAQPNKGTSYSIGWGGSTESDYISTSVNVGWNRVSPNGSGELSIGAQAFFDNWVLIFPEELRTPNTELPSTDRRRSYSFSAAYQQVLGVKLHASFSSEVIYQSGLLSTPFHRTYFLDQDTAKIEKLPSNRIKFPLSFRLNYFLGDFLVLRSFFRYYQDDIGIQAFTTSFEPRFKTSPFFSFYPFYRYHFQTGSDYFAPFKQHRLTDKYYTSDFDLSRFTSHTFGLGIHWSPLSGISRFRLFSKKRITLFSSIDLRYTYYHRSDGLHSNLLGVDLGFTKVGR